MAERPGDQTPSDARLRSLFGELRGDDEVGTPPFESVMARVRTELEAERRGGPDAPSFSTDLHSRRRRSGWTPARLGWAGGIVAAAALAGILLHSRSPSSSEAEFEDAVRAFSTNPAGGAWRSPTDRLLRIPGDELLKTLPRLGGSRWPGVTGTPFGTTQR